MREYSFLGDRIWLAVYPKSHVRSWHLWWRTKYAIAVLFHDGVRITFRRFS